MPARLAFHLDVVTPLGEHSLAWRYLPSVDQELNGREFDASLILMGINEYDVILGIDWLGQHSALIDCARRRIFFGTAEAGSFFVQGVRQGESKFVISAMKAYKSLSKGCVGYLASGVISISLELGVHNILVVCEYLDVFPDDLPGMPPYREVEFSIELAPGCGAVVKNPYRMAPAELQELKAHLQELLDKGFIRLSVSL